MRAPAAFEYASILRGESDRGVCGPRSGGQQQEHLRKARKCAWSFHVPPPLECPKFVVRDPIGAKRDDRGCRCDYSFAAIATEPMPATQASQGELWATAAKRSRARLPTRGVGGNDYLGCAGARRDAHTALGVAPVHLLPLPLVLGALGRALFRVAIHVGVEPARLVEQLRAHVRARAVLLRVFRELERLRTVVARRVGVRRLALGVGALVHLAQAIDVVARIATATSKRIRLRDERCMSKLYVPHV
jgi:hypothetical protein